MFLMLAIICEREEKQMKKQWKSFWGGVFVCLLLVGLIGSAAATIGKRTVEVDYNNIKVTMNGTAVNLVDANGSAVEPFAINGTTYLPVRAVANSLGLDVGWDGATSTVTLANKASEQQTDLLEALKFYKYMEDTTEYGEAILDLMWDSIFLENTAEAAAALQDLDDSISLLSTRAEDYTNMRNALAARQNLSDELTPASACIEDLVRAAQQMKTAQAYAESFLRTNNTEDYNKFVTWYQTAYDLLQDAEGKSYDAFDVIINQLLPGGY